VLAFFVFVLNILSNTVPDIPFQTHRLSERVLFIKTGGSTIMSNVTAIADSESVVVIDSHYKPAWGKKIRRIVKETFGGKEIRYLIYSHAGVDHMGGSPAFTDAVIIGHENCLNQIDSLHRTMESIDIREGMAPRLKRIRDQMNVQGMEPALNIKLKEAMLYWGELTDLLASGFRYTKPSITFSDRMTIRLEELTLKLNYCTPGYSQSDILIHVPQEGLLVVGDIFVKHRIPLLNEKTDLDRWLLVFKPFVENEIEIRHIIGSHGGLMTLDDLRIQLEYLEDLWKAIEEAMEKGLTLEQTKQRLSFEERYAYLGHLITRWVSTPFDLHERNIEQVWKALSNSSKKIL
jgi:glyoxylase-like metal-dependent hydrolase (beta-lactamase superfamily II)